MNVAQLRTFVTVVEHGSFSEAARAMGVSQPAVTMQVQSLESDLGAALLERRYRRVDLTDAGRALLPYAQRVLEQLDSARRQIEEMSGIVSGPLVVAASTTPGDYVIPRMLGDFLVAYPDVSVTVNVYDTAEVVSTVEAGQAHIGMTGATVRGARARFEELGRDELVGICPPGSGWAEPSKVSLAALAEERWVLRESGSGTRQVVETILRDAGIDPEGLNVVTELGTGEAIVSAVEGGLGVSILSRFVADKALKLGTVSEIRADGLPTERPLFVVLPRGALTRPAEAFLEHLRGSLG